MYEYEEINEEDFLFISKDEVLSMYSQEDIFFLATGEYPIFDCKVLSPFRKDNNPNCSYSYYNGVLYFSDFTLEKPAINCFEAIKLTTGITKFNNLLHYIVKNINKPAEYVKRDYVKKEKLPTEIFAISREFNELDGDFWGKYGIFPKDLTEDNVFAVKDLIIKKGNKRTLISNKGLSYCINVNNNKKIYSPYKKNMRFISTCTKNDIGGFGEGEDLIITKSYKDYRVLKNFNFNVRWTQSEKMFPDEDTILDLFKGYNNIYILFDNDKTGVEGSSIFKEKLSILKTNIRVLNIPNTYDAKDISDLYVNIGREKTLLFLKKIIKNE